MALKRQLRLAIRLGSVVLGMSLFYQEATAQPVTSKTFTLDADFDLGNLLNLNHNSPNNNQLQLNTVTRPFPFVNIAASGRGTAIRIDVNTGAVLSEFFTSPNGLSRDPSRTTVDKLGNVWVTNRAEASISGSVPKGSVARFGIVVGGVRTDAGGNPQLNGQYVKPPFQYNTCVDRNLDGLIKTSNGLANILPWTNAGGIDTNGGVSTADDECITNYTRVAGTNARTVAVDANNDVWVGGLGNRAHEKLSGVSGQPIGGTQFNLGCGGYGGLVDSRGILWSARGLLRFNPSVPPPTCLGDSKGNYGLGLDPTTGNIWQSSLGGDNKLYELDANGNTVNSYPQPFGAQGVAVDSNGHVWVAQIFGAQIWHLKPDPLIPGKHITVGFVGGLQGVTGVAVDANGKIWAAEINGSRASRIDPALAGGVGAIDLSVSLGAGANPYNYSDMTGFLAIGATAPSGTWNVVHDSTTPSTLWGKFSWNASTPAGTSVVVEVRAANLAAQLTAQPFVAVPNSGSVCGLGVTGRFLEVKTTLSKTPAAASGPVLFDLTIGGCDSTPPVISGLPLPGACVIWPPNHKLVQVAVVTATDSESGVASFSVTGTSNEPDDGLGDGDTANDIVINGGIVQVRAERSGLGNDRIYTLTATATDFAGNTTTKTTTCTVPHDKR